MPALASSLLPSSAASATSPLIGIVLAYFRRLIASAVILLLCWGLLGLTGACVDKQPRSTDAILNCVDAGKISLSTPLRYYGQLRDEPEKLPWGRGLRHRFVGLGL